MELTGVYGSTNPLANVKMIHEKNNLPADFENLEKR